MLGVWSAEGKAGYQQQLTAPQDGCSFTCLLLSYSVGTSLWQNCQQGKINTKRHPKGSPVFQTCSSLSPL